MVLGTMQTWHNAQLDMFSITVADDILILMLQQSASFNIFLDLNWNMMQSRGRMGLIFWLKSSSISGKSFVLWKTQNKQNIPQFLSLVNVNVRH